MKMARDAALCQAARVCCRKRTVPATVHGAGKLLAICGVNGQSDLGCCES
jgi:hypothetical protein